VTHNSTIPHPIDTPLPSQVRWYPAYLPKSFARKSDQGRLFHSRRHAEACQARAARHPTSRAAVPVIPARCERTIHSTYESNASPKNDRDDTYRFAPSLDDLSAPIAPRSTSLPSVTLTGHSAPISRPIVSVFYSVDVQCCSYPSISGNRESDNRNCLDEHIIIAAPADHAVPHTSPNSRPIVPKLRSVDALHPIYPTNPHSCELVHRNVVSKPSSAMLPYDRSTPHVAPVSLPTPLPRCTDDNQYRRYRSSHPAHDAEHRRRDSDPISFVTPSPGISTRSTPVSRPIVTPTCTNHVVDQSHPSSHSACELDHEEATFEPYSVVAPRVPVTSSTTTRAAIYAIPSRRECTPDVMVESLAPLATVRSISKEI